MNGDFDNPEDAELQADRDRVQQIQLGKEAGIFKNTLLYQQMIKQMEEDSEDAAGQLKVTNPLDTKKIMELQIQVQSCEKAVIWIEETFRIGEVLEDEHGVEEGEI